VAPSRVVTWSKRRRESGRVVPGKIGGHVPRKIRGADAGWLRARMAEGDAALRGLVAELAEPGLKVDDRTMWALAQKKPRSPVSRSGRTLPQTSPLEGATGSHRPQTARLH
jgi:transposase